MIGASLRYTGAQTIDILIKCCGYYLKLIKKVAEVSYNESWRGSNFGQGQSYNGTIFLRRIFKNSCSRMEDGKFLDTILSHVEFFRRKHSGLVNFKHTSDQYDSKMCGMYRWARTLWDTSSLRRVLEELHWWSKVL